MLSSHGMQPDEVVQKGADFNTVALATSPSSDHQLDFFFLPLCEFTVPTSQR